MMQSGEKSDTNGRLPLFYRNPYLLYLSIGIILFAGLLAYSSLARLEDPRIVQRNALILTAVPGASAERVEALVSEPIENRLEEIPEIKEVVSTSRSGFSLVSIELVDEVTDADNTEIFSEIRDNLGDAERVFPADAQAPIFDDNRGAVAFTRIFAVGWNAGGAPNLAIMSRFADDLAQQIREVPGTDLVRIYGAPSEEILVTADSSKLALHGIDLGSLSSRLAASDSEAPGGTVSGDSNEIQLEVAGDFENVERILAVPLAESEGRRITVGDVAKVERAIRDPASSLGLTGGDRIVFVAARMGQSTQVEDWTASVDEVQAEFTANSGAGVTVSTVFDQSVYTTERLDELFGNLVLGCLVVIFVVTALMGWRSAMLVSSAIPLVGAATFFMIFYLGGSLHQMSVFGMIVALGILIDNAIVIVDETRRNLASGMARGFAMQATLKQLFVPLFSSTATTVIAFAPIILLPGGSGDFVRWIGLSVIIAIVAAFAISVTVIAALAAKFTQPAASTDEQKWWRDGLRGERFSATFGRILRRSIERPLYGFALAFAAPILGFAIIPTLGNQFFPPTDRNMFDIEVTLPNSASIDRTAATAREIERELLQREGVERVDWLVGGSFPSVYYNLVMSQDESSNYAQAVITTSGPDATYRLVRELERELPAQFPQATILVGEFGQGPPANADIEFKIIGPAIAELQRLGEEAQRVVMQHPDMIATSTTMPRGIPKLSVVAEEDEVFAAGLRYDDVAAQLRSGLDGISAGTVREGIEELPVRVRYDKSYRRDTAELQSFNLIEPSGRFLPLSALGDVTLVPESAAIMRIDGERANVVRGWVASDALAINVANEIGEQLAEEGFALPPGYRLELGGVVEQDSDAQGNLGTYAPLLVTAMLATLILTFKSVTLTIPLLVVGIMSVGNAMLSTFTIAFPISFNTLIGTIGLIGLALNNSIVVIAAIRANPDAADGDPEAIANAVEGCGKHILSTTLTTVGAFLPILLLIGGTFWPSLSIVLAGGVFGSMILALIFIPASYGLIARWEKHRPFLRRSEKAGIQTSAFETTRQADSVGSPT